MIQFTRMRASPMDLAGWQSDPQKDMLVCSPIQQNTPARELDRMCDKYFGPKKGDYNFNSQISDPEPYISLTEISLIKDENLYL